MWSAVFQVFLKVISGILSKGDKSFFFSLAQYSNKTTLDIAGNKGQFSELRYPQTGGIEEVEHGLIPQNDRGDSWWCSKKPGYFGDGQGFWQSLPTFGQIYGEERIGFNNFFSHEVGEKCFE